MTARKFTAAEVDLPVAESLTGGSAYHKVERYSRTCLEGGDPDGGLSGSKDAVVSAANEPNLILRKEVVETVKNGITIFTDLDAGAPDAEQVYPPDSVYGKVQARLDKFDQILIERERGVR